MKMTSSTLTLSDHLWQLHHMETNLARSLPILAGSVLNPQLRRLLSSRAQSARQRREALEKLAKHHARPLAVATQDLVGDIMTEGNNDLARIRHPFTRDVLMTEHCIRIEHQAMSAYGSILPITRATPNLSENLKRVLSDLEQARFSLKAMRSKMATIAEHHSRKHSEKNQILPSDASWTGMLRSAARPMEMAS